jgi:PAS domain S-box-containing protein
MISASGALSGSYDYGEVARSVLIAIVASYVALDLAGRVTAASGRVRLAWLGGGATAMGLGIWAMHFKGMLAFRLPVPVEYHWPTVLASLLAAILASAVALYVACRQKRGPVAVLTSSILMGAAIAGMHYIGMAAMRLPAVTRFSALLVACSISLAVLFSLIALLVAFGRREETRWSVPRRLGSATVMGVAVSAMHYTGMAAASFIPASPPNLSHAVSISPVGESGVVIAALIVLLAVVTTSSVDHRRSEDRLRLVIDTLPALVWSKLSDGSADFLNQRFRDYTGLSVEEGLGWGWMMKAFHPEDRADEEWRAAFSGGEPFEKEARLKRADGVHRWFLLRATPLRDEHGRVVKWYGTSTDIEDRKRTEYELRRQKEVFQKIFDNIPVMIAFFGADGRIELVNSEWEHTTGWTLKEIRAQSLDIPVELYPDLQYRQMARDYAVAPTAKWTDFKVRVRDGRVIDMAAYAVRLSDGSTLGIGRDITERKRAEAELRESEARFRLVADSAPVMIWMSGTDKLCTYFNKPWLDFTGRSIDVELGNGRVEGVDPEDLQRCLDTYTQAFDRREAFTMEYRLRRHDGEFRWVSDIGVPRFNPDASFAGYIGSCIDVTEQRRAEEQLRRAEEDLARVTRVVAMGELAATIAHEVNQPLTAIVTNGHFCLRHLNGASSNPDELRAAITEIVNDSTRASAVISRIRGLLTKGASHRTELDINQIIQDVAILLRNEFTRNRVSLRTELASDLSRVAGDPVQLQQVLINLIMNAIEATSSSTNGRRKILIRSAKNPDGVLVRVQDSGPGIEPGLGNRVFEPFFTTKARGIGMGLSISHSIIESHGGRLGIVPSSTGALFEFTLPTDDAGIS